MYENNLVHKYEINTKSREQCKEKGIEFRPELQNGRYFFHELVNAAHNKLSKSGIQDLIPHEPFVKLLPWWKHNEHMTIFVKYSPANTTGDVLKCIYFARNHRDTNISPVILGGIDGSLVADTFYAYFAKHVGEPLDKEKVNDARIKLRDD